VSRRGAIAAALLAAWVAGGARAEDGSRSAAAYSRLPYGARATALGGGIAAADTEATATVNNPAGLAAMDPGAEGTLHGGLLPDGEGEFHAVMAGWVAPQLVLGLAIFARDLGEVEYRAANSLEPDSTSDAAAQVFTAALAGRLFTALDIGMSVRYMRESVEGFSANGSGVDGGLRYRPWPRVTLAVVGRNLFVSDYNWNASGRTTSDKLYGALIVGGALDLNPVLLVVQADDATGENRRFSGGAEWDLHRALTLRAGIRDGLLSAGLGLRTMVGSRLGLQLDYSLARNPLGGESFEHRIALTFAWLDWRWKRDRLLLPTEEEPPRPETPEWLRASRRPPPLFTWPDIPL